MTYRVPESDWKKFRKLREKALEKFCAQILSEVAVLAGRKTSNAHESYGDLYGLIHDRDKEIQLAFDDPRRSEMDRQLGVMRQLGLIDDSDLESFTDETLAAVDYYVRYARSPRK